MAGSSFFALLDDIAALLDDISLMSKVAAKKSASVLSDDLAVNAEQVTGMKADRELPVVWAVFKGSLRNKAILVPLALVLNALLPPAVHWLLMAGGAYLCYEGFEAIRDKFGSQQEGREPARTRLKNKTPEALAAYEQRKIKGAVRTDFILSTEIIVITLNVVAEAPLLQQVVTLVLIAILMTAGVYGIVAGIVRLDDAGLALRERDAKGAGGRLLQRLGEGMIWVAPRLMKALSWIGTLAMFLVGGTFIAEGIAPIQSAIDTFAEGRGGVVTAALLDGLVGAVAGAVVAAVASVAGRLWHTLRPAQKAR